MVCQRDGRKRGGHRGRQAKPSSGRFSGAGRAGAGHGVRQGRGHAVSRFFRHPDRERQHARSLPSRRAGVSWLVRTARAARAAGHSANPRRRLDQGSEGDACGADRQAAPSRSPASVRLAGNGARPAEQSALSVRGPRHVVAKAKHRSSMLAKRAPCSTASPARRRSICATRR